MVCIHGDVGLGKTLAVNTSLRDLAPHTLWLECRKGASLTALCSTLFRLLELPGEEPSHIDDYDLLLRKAFSEQDRVLVCDEAQGLTNQALDYLRTLWDAKRFTLVLVGGENCLRRIRSRPALASRIALFQQYHPLTPDEVLAVMARYHKLWQGVPAEDLLWVNDVACHGNFRNWAKTTFHIQETLEADQQDVDEVEKERDNRQRLEWFSRDTVRMVLSFLDSTVRGLPGGPPGYL
ncbi:ATP-binding protein [Streptomyces sp. NPDC047085]|uniref:ATP-binding protein n=1 Tax=Streptomyces sp. NPDC047085 TaxID=3155140 RepID=UPI00340773A2